MFGGVSKRVWLALGIVYVVWGSTYLAIRVADETIPPLLMAAARFLVAGGILYAVSIRRGDVDADPIGPKQWRAAALIGGLLLLGGNGLVVWAERRVGSGTAALMVAAAPIWMAVIAARRNDERVFLRVAIGLGLGFAGVALLVEAGGRHGGSPLPGMIALIFAPIFWALGSVPSRRAALPKRPFVSTAMEMLCGGAMLLVGGVVTGEFGALHLSRISLASIEGLLYLIVFGSLAGFSAYVWVLQKAPTTLVSTYAYVNPVIAVFLGWLVLHERLTPMTLLAAVLIVGAVAMIVLGQAERRQASVR